MDYATPKEILGKDNPQTAHATHASPPYSRRLRQLHSCAFADWLAPPSKFRSWIFP